MGNYLDNASYYGVDQNVLKKRNDIIAWFNSPAIIEKVKESITSDVSPDLFLTLMKSAANLGNFDKVSQTSIYTALIEAARTGLPPTPGRIWFIPRYNSKTRQTELNLQIGYQGYLDLMRRGGYVCYANVVYKDDEFKVRQGTKPGIKHVPNINSERLPEDLIAAYAVAIVGTTGERIFEVLTRAEINRIRQKCVPGNSKPWDEWTAEMWRKTAIMRIRKLCPLDASANEAIVADERRIFGDWEPVKTKTSGAAQLKKKLGIAPQPTESPFVLAVQNATTVEELDEIYENATVAVDSGAIDVDEYETAIRELSERKRILEPGTFGGRA
jgi:phage RecT family recombinase